MGDHGRGPGASIPCRDTHVPAAFALNIFFSLLHHVVEYPRCCLCSLTFFTSLTKVVLSLFSTNQNRCPRHIEPHHSSYIYELAGRIRNPRPPAEPRLSISRVGEHVRSKHTIHLYIKPGWLWPITDHVTLDEVCQIRRDNWSDPDPSFFHCMRQIQPYTP